MLPLRPHAPAKSLKISMLRPHNLYAPSPCSVPMLGPPSPCSVPMLDKEPKKLFMERSFIAGLSEIGDTLRT